MPTRTCASTAFPLLLAALSFLAARPTAAIELTRNENALARIVLPAQPLPVESYAAKELQYHIKSISGAELPIVSEADETNTAGNIYLGHCRSSHREGLDSSSLPGNGYSLKITQANAFITGRDSEGDPLDIDTHAGTLFAIYDLLEQKFHVRWLWPGRLGEVIPKQKNLSLTPRDTQVTPRLWFKVWRNNGSKGELVWLRRQRFGRSVRPSYGHSFGDCWSRFGQTHPEYFAMLPDGTRRLDPTAEPGPEWVHMCVSAPGLTHQIIADWKSKGMPEFLNVCENDGWAGCACPICLSWDEPAPNEPVAFDQRLQAARKAFAGELGRRDEWMLQLGSLSDRYARFWKRVADDAVRARPNIKVVSYVYDNYRLPPVKAKLSANVFCGLVPQESIFGYSKLDSDVFRKDWSGWERTGCALFLRPNYTLQAPNFPAFYARTLGGDLQFAMDHGLKGTDFDSLTGKYAVQGPSLFMLATILNHPEMAPDAVLNEFYAAFGSANRLVRDYFNLWESIYPNFSPAEQAEKIQAKRKYGAGLYGPYYLLADEIFTPEAMAKAESLLEAAQKQTAWDATASARVNWLIKGLKQTSLMLATQRDYQRAIDTGDAAPFLGSYQALKEFRDANADYDRLDFAGLTGDEPRWEKLARKSPTTLSH